MTDILDLSFDDFLAHHGIKGQKWGVRNARKNFVNIGDDVYARQERHRYSATISEEKYKQLSDKDIVIKKGAEVSRVSVSPTLDRSTDKLYVSTNEKDANNYRALIPTGANGGYVGRKHEGYYETTYRATQDLKSPSEKKRVDAYATIMGQREIKLGNGETVTGREYLRRSGLGPLVDGKTDAQLAKMYYGQLASQQGMRDEPLNSAYFKALQKKGYNALVDDNDRKILSDEPLLILSATKTLETASVKQLTTNEVHKAQTTMRLPDI